MRQSEPTLAELVSRYRNSAKHNDEVYQELTAATWRDPLLAAHRRHVEAGNLGFGDAAFHAMWLRLLTAAAERFGAVRALEIGVFKGQVISLWSALARQHGLDVTISAITPLAGQPPPAPSVWNWLRSRLDARHRERCDNGNFYADEDYEAIVRSLFNAFEVSFDRVTLHRGFSTDPAILSRLSGESFHLIYVDGDHTYAGALHDFTTFGPKVVAGGWLVADDASCELPGTAFWKGHEAVSRAARIIPSLGFENVLNVGHNRVFERKAR